MGAQRERFKTSGWVLAEDKRHSPPTNRGAPAASHCHSLRCGARVYRYTFARGIQASV